jgi:hypothetical protein
MTKSPEHGNASTGRPIADAEVNALAIEAEGGYDVGVLVGRRAKRGRPSLGSAPSSVESVRLDSALRDELAQRAATDGTTPSEVLRQALRRYLRAT